MVTLYPARLVKRYKRFLADVQLPSGEVTTLHCPNTGSMKNCVVVDSPCWYSQSDNPKRKYPYTLEIVTTPTGHLAGINTGRANGMVEDALRQGRLSAFTEFDSLKREVKFGHENSRVDFCLSYKTGADSAQDLCFIEVKNLTLMEALDQGSFPDAVTERGTKHLRELMAVQREGHRAALIFCVQHTGVEWVEPARHIDPVYADTLAEAAAAGVIIKAYRAHFPEGQLPFLTGDELPVRL